MHRHQIGRASIPLKNQREMMHKKLSEGTN